MLDKTFIEQLEAVDFYVSDPKQAAKKKAELVGKWIQEIPLEFFGELRDRSPIFPTPLFTIVTRYADVMEVFENDKIFTIDAFKQKIQRNIGSFILGMNNSPEYERQKSILRLAFRREDAAYFQQIVIEESSKLLKQFTTIEKVDLVIQYARMLPALAIRRYLGLEQVPPEKILQWTHPLFQDVFANITNNSKIEQQALNARIDAVAYLDDLIASSRQQKCIPGETNVLNRLLEMQALASTGLSDEEVRNCLIGLLVGTIDLTSIAIIKALIELLSRPEILIQAQTAARQDNDEAIASYVWEALRFRPPVVGLLRTCTQDYILGCGTPHQTQIKAGTIIYAASAAAMHDATQIDNPSEFRVGRPPKSYLFFESGLHTCFGKYFSLVQIPLAIKGLLNLDNYKLASTNQTNTTVLLKAVGRLVFSDNTQPLHNMRVELWDIKLGNNGKLLGQGVTNRDGYFEIEYNPQSAAIDALNLELRIIETRFSFDASDKIVASRRLVYTVKGEDKVTSQRYNFGTCCVPYWIYNPNSPFPRIKFTDLDNTPDQYPIGRQRQGYEVAARYQPLHLKHLLENKLSPNQLSIKAIQKDYPPNLTIKAEQEKPEFTRSDEFFSLRALNGMNPCIFKQNQINSNQYKVSFNWDAYEKDDIHDLHNVDALFEIANGELLPVAITIQMRKPDATAPFSPLTEPVTYTPENPEKWLQAKRIFRTNYLYSAQLIEHYVKAHLQMEQYAIAAFRNLRNNPVRLLLLPHLKSVININRQADAVLVSESAYITTSGPLSWNGVQQVCHDVMQQLDWQAWQPRKPLVDSHTYAKVANLYWDILTDYVNCFFEKYQAAIKQEWFEIRALSDDLVEHSVPYQGSKENQQQGEQTCYKWYDCNELDKSEISRAEVNGVLKAVRPITLSNYPQHNEIENLKQFCRYVIFHTTLWHSWVNDLQTEDGGEVAYSSIALRNGSFGTEEDANIAPTAEEATGLLYLVNTLSQVKYGYILKNEDGDIPQEFRTILSHRREDFAQLNYEVNNIRALINI